MSNKQINKVGLWAYLTGYYAYLSSAVYFAWPKLGWLAIIGMYGVYQSFIALVWPVWIIIGYWPLVP
jgi:hypothetical protein